MNEFLRTIHCSIFKKWVTYNPCGRENPRL